MDELDEDGRIEFGKRVCAFFEDKHRKTNSYLLDNDPDFLNKPEVEVVVLNYGHEVSAYHAGNGRAFRFRRIKYGPDGTVIAWELPESDWPAAAAWLAGHIEEDEAPSTRRV